MKPTSSSCWSAPSSAPPASNWKSKLIRKGLTAVALQPVASDLRRVVSAMKLSSDLERMADQATTIARRARKLNQHPPLAEVELMRPLYEQAMSMFKDSVDAFVREDVDLGCGVVARDEKLDDLTHSASRKLIDRMAQ